MSKHIKLHGVRVHNLKSISLTLPCEKLIVFCGRSGSGKSSLAMDTLFAEGQRRYMESFSIHARQFLEKTEKPDAELIEGLPAAVAVTAKPVRHVTRSTVGTATEIADHLRLLFSKIGLVTCPCCGREIREHTPQSIAALLETFPPETRMMIAFAPEISDPDPDFSKFQSEWRERGFIRGVVHGNSFRLDESPDESLFRTVFSVGPKNDSLEMHNSDDSDGDNEGEDSDEGKPREDAYTFEKTQLDQAQNDSDRDEPDPNGRAFFDLDFKPGIPSSDPVCEHRFPDLLLIADRLSIGKIQQERLAETLESALEHGEGRCYVFVDTAQEKSNFAVTGYSIDGDAWKLIRFSRGLECEGCGFSFPLMEPRLFSFTSPLGACPTCEGFGNVRTFDRERIVPHPEKTIREGAIAPWNTPSYKKKLDEFFAVAPQLGIPTDVPFSELSPQQIQTLVDGSVQHKYQGLKAFFENMHKQKYKMHIRVYLSRWQSYHPCPECHGTRLRKEACAVTINGQNIAEICSKEVSALHRFFEHLELPPWQQEIVKTPLSEIRNRLRYLEQVGLAYLTLDRTMRTLSGGEQRRVDLTTGLGSSLVNMLYVLDEPSIGLHPHDTDRLLQSLHQLRDRENTIVVVEHEEAILRAADHIVEIGPEAGAGGGFITFEGTVLQMLKSKSCLTGNYLSGRLSGGIPTKRRKTEHGFLELTGARGNNLKNIDVRFPLGLLCVVTGVSGSGKTTLVQETLYPAVCHRFKEENHTPGLPFDQILGTGQLDDVIMVDQSPIGRSPRSNPVTYLKIFDEIRNIFASTTEAKMRNLTAGCFSFNVDGGRCNTCHGDGMIMIDMHFMSDMYMKCPQCRGSRFQRDILEITYRGRNISEILEMTVREAFLFFRGQPKVQTRLKKLIDVGLDYICLGQPSNTLSGGELQRLKLAFHLSQPHKGHSLFILDEPTTGLHFADIVQLLDCFDALIETGHSLIVVEHNLQLIRAADHVIDLGPGPASEGGTILVQGTPEEVAACHRSFTGRYLDLADMPPHQA